MKTISTLQLFEAVHLAILNSSAQEEVQKRLAVFGVNSKYMQTGNSLLERARSLYTVQEQHYNDTRRLSLQIEQDNSAALDIFKEHVNMARLAFRKEAHILQELKIRKLNSGKWNSIQQARDFYDRTSPYMDRLKQFGATDEAFAQNKASVEALLDMKAQRMIKKGEAENSTQEKSQATKALREWYAEFRKLARIAFRDKPQVLEGFGIVVATAKKKTKSTAQAA